MAKFERTYNFRRDCQTETPFIMLDVGVPGGRGSCGLLDFALQELLGARARNCPPLTPPTRLKVREAGVHLICPSRARRIEKLQRQRKFAGARVCLEGGRTTPRPIDGPFKTRRKKFQTMPLYTTASGPTKRTWIARPATRSRLLQPLAGQIAADVGEFQETGSPSQSPGTKA